jgi:hypothetical protein
MAAPPFLCTCGARCSGIVGSLLVEWSYPELDLERSAKRAALELDTFANDLRRVREGKPS